MSHSDSTIYLQKPRDEVAQKLDNLINRGENIREKIIKKPPSSNEELSGFVAEKNGAFHIWIYSIEQAFRSSFSPAAKLLGFLSNVHHQQWQYQIPWQERANALPADINTHLAFLKDIRGRVINIYEEAPPDVSNEQSFPELRQFMNKHFNKDELQGLCFDLGIDFENFQGYNRDILVIELIGYASRHDKLPNLIKRVKELHPQENWTF
jgi:hypothetical protein